MRAVAEIAAAPDDASSQQARDGPAAEATETEVRVRRYSRTTMALTILAGIAVIASLYFARAFFVPLLIGILASYTLRPVVDCLHRLLIPQAIAVALVMAVLVGGAGWMAYSLSDDATVLIEK